MLRKPISLALREADHDNAYEIADNEYEDAIVTLLDDVARDDAANLDNIREQVLCRLSMLMHEVKTYGTHQSEPEAE